MAGVHHPDVLGLDGDPPLPLDVHGVEVLLPHEPGVDGPGDLEDAVGQGRLAVVDVADDGEVADELDRNGSSCGDGGRHGPSIVPAQVGGPGRLARTVEAAPPRWRRPKEAHHLLQLSSAPVRPRPAAAPFRRRLRIDTVANIKSQIKRNRQNEKRRLRNKSVRAELRTRTKSAVERRRERCRGQRRGAAPGREADRQGGRQGRHPQEHGGQPQVASGAAGGRHRGGGRRVAAASPPSPSFAPDHLFPVRSGSSTRCCRVRSAVGRPLA